MEKICNELLALVHIMERLRGKDGCPWDKKQTPDTVKEYLLEEAYEVVDAVEKKDSKALCEELGDLFFQIIFLSHLAKEKGEFSLLDVFRLIKEKMIRRHPHVFGDVKVKDAEEVLKNWARIKEKEKKGSEKHPLEDIPLCLPALLRAQKLSEKAARFGFDWKDKKGIWEKVKEEFRELEEAIESEDKERVKEEIGDLLFSIVNLSRHWKLNAEQILREANRKFVERFKKMEEELKKRGLSLESATLEQMDSVWEKIKKDV